MNKAAHITTTLEQRVLNVQAFYANHGSTVSSVLLAVELIELSTDYGSVKSG